MKNKLVKWIIWMVFTAVWATNSSAQYYFPPKTGNTWDTISPSSLGWCTERIDSLFKLLNDRDTKAFIILKDGKIAIEKYFGSFTVDSPWYWASAGKTITATLIGIAQQEKLLSISDSTSKYLGVGWTQCVPEKERFITVKNQLCMTTGLNYEVPDLNCKLPSCLTYKTDAGAQWYYHNAPYLLLHDVLESASGVTLQQYTNTKLNQKIGTGGIWLDGVFYSRPRAMARFGSLILNKGIWENDTIIKDTSYYKEMIQTSQNLNASYGYLWWLNGKQSYKIPGTILTLPGKLFPTAPNDLFAGLGKNDQKLYVWPSQNIVIARMGNSADTSPVPIIFDTILWNELNRLFCSKNTYTNSIIDEGVDFMVYPNPAQNYLSIEVENLMSSNIQIYNSKGEFMLSQTVNPSTEPNSHKLMLDEFASGTYTIQITNKLGTFVRKFVVVK
jgi:CubicO group peptidase (beta-lactamase class C family)